MSQSQQVYEICVTDLLDLSDDRGGLLKLSKTGYFCLARGLWMRRVN